jgi:hypothetical protein
MNIQEAKTQATLNKVFRYPEGIMSRREYIKLHKSQGAEVKESMRNKIEFNRTKYNRLEGRQQEEYEKKLEEKIVSYELHFSDKSLIYITKAEFDYFNSL